jgi:hypothetical protein
VPFLLRQRVGIAIPRGVIPPRVAGDLHGMRSRFD